ncbi:MAG: NUDIX domain-containing protein [Bacilli bacterium]|nr:NUDIX domain-containing protein [Bacilli bacterium]
MLFRDEVNNLEELVNRLSKFDQDFGKIKACVICFVFDKDGNLILNRRGPGARDEVGMLQAIGGSVNHSDIDFRSAIMRELKEEAGNAEFEIETYLGAVLNPTVDKTTGDVINWIIIGYKGRILSGEVENMEPDRCIGFEKAKMDQFKKSEISRPTYIFIEDMLKNE